MKTTINQKGLVSDPVSEGFEVFGRDYREAVFDQRWDDLYAFIDEGTGPASLTYEEYRDTGFFMRFFRHNQNDNIFMMYQMPHQWDITTAVHPHMHVIPMAAATGTVIMDYVYSWCLVNNGTLPAASGWTSGSVTSSFVAADQFVQKVISFGYLEPPAGAQASAILVFKVERPAGTDDDDTYSTNKTGGTAAANLGVLFFDLHYQKLRAGTVDEHPEV